MSSPSPSPGAAARQPLLQPSSAASSPPPGAGKNERVLFAPTPVSQSPPRGPGLPRQWSSGHLTGIAVPPPPPHDIPDLKQVAARRELEASSRAVQITEPVERDPFAHPKLERDRRPKKVGGLRWWCIFALLGLCIVIFASLMTSGVGFEGGTALPDQCWKFVVNEFHEHCALPLLQVVNMELCEIANVFFFGNKDIAIKEADATHHAKTPGCYSINGVITWDLYDNMTTAEHDYYPICQGSAIRQTERCQEDWSNRIGAVGWVLLSCAILGFVGCVGFLLMCFIPALASACGWEVRVGGTDAGDIINAPRPKEQKAAKI